MKKKQKPATKISVCPKDKTAELKLQIVIDTISMTNEERSVYCQQHGIQTQNIDEWKEIILSSLDDVRNKNQTTQAAIDQLNNELECKAATFIETTSHLDMPAVKITLHPGAINYLFEHFYTLRRIFSNVLGQMETDYLAIALINKSKQIFFLSSNPSIEQNMIEQNLWSYDGSFSPDFIYQDKPKLWKELYNPKHSSRIYNYKYNNLKLITGISIPADYAEYRAVFSFGFKAEHTSLSQQFPQQLKKMMAMGNFCLQEITKSIPMLDKIKILNSKSKAKLRLIYNRKVFHENIIG